MRRSSIPGRRFLVRDAEDLIRAIDSVVTNIRTDVLSMAFRNECPPHKLADVRRQAEYLLTLLDNK